MEIYFNNIEKKSNNNGNRTRGVGLGNFDGVHLGHQAIINTLVRKCKEKNFTSLIYTFKNHPNNILFEQKTLLIISPEQKSKIIKTLGVDELFFADFDMEYAHMTPEMFVKNIIVDQLGAGLVVVGYDYTFGCYGQGKAQDLIVYGEKYGFEVVIVPPVTHVMPHKSGAVNDVVVSSTVLRQLIKEGNVEQYNMLTGRYYTIPGEVVFGNQRGSKFGFPTANIIPSKEFAIPHYGVYATQTLIGNKMYRSITNIGDNPTFGDVNRPTVETHVLEFEGWLYGNEISVFFLEKIRNEIKFPSIDNLISQIKSDYETRRKMEDELIEYCI